MTTHECPTCHHVSDLLKGVGHLAGNPRGPRKGDMTLCAKCGEFSVFGDEGLRLPTEGEKAIIDSDPTAVIARDCWLKQAKRIGGMNA